MNYRHAYHAGNFADVIKHAILCRVLMHLRDKPAAFRVIDTHAGAGRYDLAAGQAARTGEWRDGIGRLCGAELADALVAAGRKWATGIYLVWYPIKDRVGPDRLAAVLRRSAGPKSGQKVIRVELEWASAGAGGGLAGAGLVIVNPPWRLAGELGRILPALRAALGLPAGNRAKVDWLAREG